MCALLWAGSVAVECTSSSLRTSLAVSRGSRLKGKNMEPHSDFVKLRRPRGTQRGRSTELAAA
eukprot:450678-Pleurochrysis_carterae.AAC.3